MKMKNDPADSLSELRAKMKEVAETLFPTSSINEELNSHVKAVRECVDEAKVKQYVPRLVLNCKQGDEFGMVVIGIPDFPGENSMKQHTMKMLGLAAAANDFFVLNAIFEVEAWSRPFKEGDPEANKVLTGEKRVSELPDRQEVIILTSMTMDGRHAFATIPITGRNADETLILGEPDVHECDSETKCKDSLLAAFWEGFIVAEGAKIAAKLIDAKGDELPPEIIKILEIMESAPKFQKVV